MSDTDHPRTDTVDSVAKLLVNSGSHADAKQAYTEMMRHSRQLEDELNEALNAIEKSQMCNEELFILIKHGRVIP